MVAVDLKPMFAQAVEAHTETTGLVQRPDQVFVGFKQDGEGDGAGLGQQSVLPLLMFAVVFGDGGSGGKQGGEPCLSGEVSAFGKAGFELVLEALHLNFGFAAAVGKFVGVFGLVGNLAPVLEEIGDGTAD